jgi:activating signal cointegrator 1
MKALSIYNPYAQLVVKGFKQYEVRSKRTNYRGELLICAAQKKEMWYKVFNPLFCFDTPRYGTDSLYKDSGCAIGVVNLIDCRPMQPEDCDFSFTQYDENAYVWVFSNAHSIAPFEVKGQQGLFNVQPPDGWMLF